MCFLKLSMKEGSYIFFKGILLLLTLLITFFTAHFWMGTQEVWDKAMETNLFSFFRNRFIMTLIISLFTVIISLLCSAIYKYKFGLDLNFVKTVLLEVIFAITLSLLFVYLAILTELTKL